MRQVIVKTAVPPPSGSSWSCPLGSFSATSPYTTSTDRTAVACFIKARVGLDQKKTAVSVYFSGSFTQGQQVKVCVQYETSSLTGAYGPILDGKILDTEVESIIEQTSTTLSPFQETQFPGDLKTVQWAAACNTV